MNIKKSFSLAIIFLFIFGNTVTKAPSTKCSSVKSAIFKANITKEEPVKTAFNNLKSSSQLIIVSTEGLGTCHGKLETYEKINGKWVNLLSCDAVVGLNGFNYNKREGDKCTPVGIFDFVFLFGSAPNPGFKMTYRKATTKDYWVSNRNLSDYNVWRTYDGDPSKVFYDYENLGKQPLFKYAAVINFNYGSDKIMDKGSGIFLHIRPTNGGGTLGCIGISESNLIKVFKWLDPKKSPLIIEGPKEYVDKFK